MSDLTDEQRETLAMAAGEHTPVYDYRSGRFTMECEACAFMLYGIDRADAKRRFGEHIAEALAPVVARMLADARAEAWDEGWDARDDNYWSGDQNPYRQESA